MMIYDVSFVDRNMVLNWKVIYINICSFFNYWSDTKFPAKLFYNEQWNLIDWQINLATQLSNSLGSRRQNHDI